MDVMMCDKCGEVDRDGVEWLTLTHWPAPQTPTAATRRHLCGSCSDSFADWLAEGPKP